MRLSLPRSLALATLAALTLTEASAQQDVQYTQFMYDKLTFNPAYAGTKGYPAVSAIARQQWVGFDGAPSSQALRFHAPLRRDHVGLGLRLQNDLIGPTRATSAGFAYAYHLALGAQTYLGLGLDASALQYRIDWGKLYGADDEPGSALEAPTSRIVANVGAGALLYGDRFYVGLSAPRLLQNRLSSSDDILATEGKEALHGYLMAGYDLHVGADYSLRPAVQVKYATNAPLDADVNATVVWRELLGLGLSYRTGGALTEARGESIDVLVSVMPTRRLTIGLAYDHTLTQIRDYSSGSYELMVGYVIAPQTDFAHNPRYF